MTTRPAQISASLLNADFARLGDEVRRAVEGGVDSIHLDVMDGHFVENLTLGPVVVQAVRPIAAVPYHTHLMVSQPLRHARAFADAGSDLIVAHVEADDDPGEVIGAIHGYGRAAGLALNPETPAEAVVKYLASIDLLLVMTVHPGRGGQAFISHVLPKIAQLRDEMRGEIKRLHHQLPTTMIYVTHDQIEAMTLADRIVLMRRRALEQIERSALLFDDAVAP